MYSDTHPDHGTFVDAARSNRLVEVTFYNKSEEREETRLLGPQDFGPNRQSHDSARVYWFIDVNDRERRHVFPKRAEFISAIAGTDLPFDRQRPAVHLS